MHSPDPDLVVAEARKWMGTRWVHQGRSTAGVDCAGLIIMVAKTLGADSGDMTGYKRTPNARQFLEHIRSQTDLAQGPKPGQIAIFRQSAFPCHVGIFTERHDSLYFIHSYAGMSAGRRVIEEPFSHHWIARLVECRTFRIPE